MLSRIFWEWHSGCMKKFSLLMSLSLLLCSVGFGDPGTPLLRYEFDQAGTLQSSTGSKQLDLVVASGPYNSPVPKDYITEAPVQRAGVGSNLVLNFKGSNVDAGLPDTQTPLGSAEAALDSENAAFLREGLGSFTISGWLLQVASENHTEINLRRILSLRNPSGGVVDLTLNAPNGAASGTLSLDLSGSLGKMTFNPSAVSIPLNSSSWYFFSITYDASTGELNFYAGEEGGALSHSVTYNTNTRAAGGVVNELLTNSTLLAIGNAGYYHQRRLDAYFSDFRIYGEALTAQQVDGIYSIPEPGVSMLLGAGLLLASFYSLKHVAR